MKRWNRLARIAALVAPIVLVLGCTQSALQTQIRAANVVALAANEALPAMIAQYRADGLAAIAAAPDRPAAERALAETRSRWHSVWGTCDGEPLACRDGAWPALRAAHDAWAAALERYVSGAPLDVAAAIDFATRLRAAYCNLRGALPASVRLPDVPGATCPVSGRP